MKFPLAKLQLLLLAFALATFPQFAFAGGSRTFASLTVSPSSTNINTGATATVIATLTTAASSGNTASGYITNTVSISPVDPTMTVSINPNNFSIPVSSSSNMTVQVATAIYSTPGTYTVTVVVAPASNNTAYATTIPITNTFSVNVTGGLSDSFQITAVPASESGIAGVASNYSSTLTYLDRSATISGIVTNNVAVSPSGQGVTASLNTNYAAITNEGGTTNLTLSISQAANTPAGSYQIIVTGTNSAFTANSPVPGSFSVTNTVAVVDHSAFTMGMTPKTETVDIGMVTNVTSTVTITNLSPVMSGTITNGVTVSPSGMGVTANLNTPYATVNAGNGTSNLTLTISATASAPLGSYQVIVSGTNSAFTGNIPSGVASVTNSFVVANLNSFALGLGTASESLSSGKATNFTTTLTVTDLSPALSGTISNGVTVSPAGQGVTASLSPANAAVKAGGGTSNLTLTISATAGALMGNYQIVVSGTNSAFTANSPIPGIASVTNSLVLISNSPSSGFWYSAYLNGYDLKPGGSVMYTSNVDYTAMTHLIHFALYPGSNGTFDAAINGITASQSTDVVARAHAAGTKVLISVGGASTTSRFEASTTSTYLNTFVSNLVSFVATYGYDGVDVDWEYPAPTNPSQQQFTNFIIALRLALKAQNPQSLLTAPAAMAPTVYALVQNDLDQINLMPYDLADPLYNGITWFDSCLYTGTAPQLPGNGGPQPSTDSMLSNFLAAGISPGKIGVGMEFYGDVWTGGAGTSTGGVTLPRQTWTTAPSSDEDVPYYTIISQYYQSNLVFYDTNAQEAYLSISNASAASCHFITYEDPHTVQAKVSYARNLGLGGVMIFDVEGGYLSSQPANQREPLLEAVKQAIATPSFTSVTTSGQNVNVSFNSAPLAAYRVLWTTNPMSTTWTTLTNNVWGAGGFWGNAGGVVQVTDPGALGQSGQRFYRLKTPP